MNDSRETLSMVLDFRWGQPSHYVGPWIEILNNVVGREPEVEHQVTLLAGGPPSTQHRELSWAISVPDSGKVEPNGRPDARGQFRLKGLAQGQYNLRVSVDSPALAEVSAYVSYKAAAATDAAPDGEEFLFATEDGQTLVGRVTMRAQRLLLVIEGDPRALVGRMIRFTVGREGSFQAQGFVGLYTEGPAKCRGEVELESISHELGRRPPEPFAITAKAIGPEDLGIEDLLPLELSIQAAGNKHSRGRLEEVYKGFAGSHAQAGRTGP